jgi:hypothetical protein
MPASERRRGDNVCSALHNAWYGAKWVVWGFVPFSAPIHLRDMSARCRASLFFRSVSNVPSPFGTSLPQAHANDKLQTLACRLCCVPQAALSHLLRSFLAVPLFVSDGDSYETGIVQTLPPKFDQFVASGIDRSSFFALCGAHQNRSRIKIIYCDTIGLDGWQQ